MQMGYGAIVTDLVGFIVENAKDVLTEGRARMRSLQGAKNDGITLFLVPEYLTEEISAVLEKHYRAHTTILKDNPE